MSFCPNSVEGKDAARMMLEQAAVNRLAQGGAYDPDGAASICSRTTASRPHRTMDGISPRRRGVGRRQAPLSYRPAFVRPHLRDRDAGLHLVDAILGLFRHFECSRCPLPANRVAWRTWQPCKSDRDTPAFFWAGASIALKEALIVGKSSLFHACLPPVVPTILAAFHAKSLGGATIFRPARNCRHAIGKSWSPNGLTNKVWGPNAW
jgi:hypothetical protein